MTLSIKVDELVAGDIILLETGNRVPADCVLIDGTDISVDERFYHPENKCDIRNKNFANEANFNTKPDPFIYT